MKVTLRTNLDLSPANRSALRELEECFNYPSSQLPRVNDRLQLDRIQVEVCSIRWKPKKLAGDVRPRLFCEVEVNVCKGWTITQFHKAQGTPC